MNRAMSCFTGHQQSALPARQGNYCLALVAAVIASTVSTSSTALASLIPGRVNNYSECVIRQLQPATGTLEIDVIVGDCRNQFPAPSQRNLLDPRSVQSCFQRHQKRIAHRPAAKALLTACQDYFRRG